MNTIKETNDSVVISMENTKITLSGVTAAEIDLQCNVFEFIDSSNEEDSKQMETYLKIYYETDLESIRALFRSLMESLLKRSGFISNDASNWSVIA